MERSNPFFETGTRLKGHEFHYSHVKGGQDSKDTVVALERGPGLSGHRDGVVEGRVWASYLHLHALGAPEWAKGLVELARLYRDEEPEASAACG